MARTLGEIGQQLEELGQGMGLDYFPLHFEEVPQSFMLEIAVYGLPVRMAHWSFGVRYIHQMIQRRMGHSRLYEVVFPGNPGRAYLAKGNSIPENTLVIAHVLGHADFSKNNGLFRRVQDEIGYQIVELAASHAKRIEQAIEEHGQKRVETVLDAALALEAHIDSFKSVHRSLYPKYCEPSAYEDGASRSVFICCPAQTQRSQNSNRHRLRQKSRPAPSRICCGLSRTMRLNSKAGSVIFFSPYAKNRSIFSRYLPARS